MSTHIIGIGWLISEIFWGKELFTSPYLDLFLPIMFYHKSVQYSPPEHVVLEEKVLPVQKIHRTRSRDETRIDTKPETAKLGKRKTDGHLLSDGKFSEAKNVIEVMQQDPF